MGFALGVLRLSLDDFCRLSIDEFEAICETATAERESLYKDRWERMRLLATITIQPHVKGRLQPERLLPLPWDAPSIKAKKKPAAPPLSDEEALRRFELVRKRVERNG